MLQSKRGQSLSTTRRLTLTAVFAALAFAVMFVFRFNITFLTFDLKDTIITIAGLILGPVVALTVSLLVAVLEFITIGDTGWYGFLMNFSSSATFSVVCAMVYRYNKKLSGAIIALLSALMALLVVMLSLNCLVTPLYVSEMGMTRQEVMAMIPTLFLPFNAIKGAVNAALVLILYKPVRQALYAAKLMPKSASAEAQAVWDPAEKKKRILRSVCVTFCGVLLLTVLLTLFMTLLHGDFSWVPKLTWFENFKGLFGEPS